MYRVTLAVLIGGIAPTADIEADGYTNEHGSVRFWNWLPKGSHGAHRTEDIITFAPGAWAKIERVIA